MSLRVLHVAETAKGGCGTYLNEIVPLQLQALGAAQVRCLVPAEHRAQLAEVPDEAVHCFDRPSRRAGLRHLALALNRMLDQGMPDLIHAHSTFAGALVRGLSLLRPLPPIVYCPHGWVFDAMQGRASRRAAEWAERVMAPRAGRIVAISESERQAGLRAGIAPARLALVPNGIGPAPEVVPERWDDERLRVLFVGRLDRQKGADLLLQAVRPLADRVSLRIVGEQVQAEAASSSAAPALPQVEYLGWQDKRAVAAQMAACDLVVMPSRWEGFGLVAIEAMRAGRAVLASAVGGLAEVVVDGVTGRLVPVGDVQALRDALATLDRPRLAQMGAAGRQRFEQHYTSEATHEALLRLYDALLHGADAQAAPRLLAGRGG